MCAELDNISFQDSAHGDDLSTVFDSIKLIICQKLGVAPNVSKPCEVGGNRIMPVAIDSLMRIVASTTVTLAASTLYIIVSMCFLLFPIALRCTGTSCF